MARSLPPTASPDPLSLTPAQHHILLALLPGERHGYAIMRDVERMTDGATRIGPGTLYGNLKKLLADRLIESCGERGDPEAGERRRYYRLTTPGREAVATETERLRALVRYAGQHLRSMAVPA